MGVDIARVSPSAVAEQAVAGGGIDLVVHSETPAEDVPEPDGSADIVSSVFGIEYSDVFLNRRLGVRAGYNYSYTFSEQKAEGER